MTQIYQRLSEGAIEAWDGLPFDGAKGAILWRSGVVTILRDDRPGLAFAGMWDLPGGGREGHETPFETFAREAQEEVGINIHHGSLIWQRGFKRHLKFWFLVVEMPDESPPPLLGDEGQALQVTTIDNFVSNPDAILHLRERLKAFAER